MADPQVVKSRFLMSATAILAVTSVVLGIRPRCPSEGPANLVVYDADTVGWMPITNTYAVVEGIDKNGNPTHDRDLWTGLLFQLGHYQSGDVIFKEVLLKGPGVNMTLTRGDFTWINIVANETASRHDPLTPDKDEYALYPNTHNSGLCAQIDECAETGQGHVQSCPGTSNPSLSDIRDCLRRHRLHREIDFDMNTPTPARSVITYWQGKHGYKMTSVQTPQASPLDVRDRFRFWFQDPFSVTIYKAGATGANVVDKVFGPGDIDTIEVNPKPKGPTHGTHQDPPWMP